MRLGKGKIKLTSKQWPIMMGAQKIFEDICIFENPFPTPEQDMTAKSDAWRFAARLSNVTGVIRDLDKDIEYIVSGLSHTSSLSNVMQLRKMHNNLKSRVVHQVKTNIRTLYGIEGVNGEFFFFFFFL